MGIVSKYIPRPVIARVEGVLGFIIFYTMLPFLWIAELIRPIRIGVVKTGRIGHMVEEPDLLLKRIQAEILDSNALYLLFGGHPVCNLEAVKLIKRVTHFFHGKNYGRFIILIRPYLQKTRFFVELFEPTRDWAKYLPLYQNPKTRKNYYWTDEEEARGWEALRKMGVERDQWFMCFHTRDASYLAKAIPDKNFGYHNFRDAPISTYLKAAQFISEQGGYSLRMGAVVEEPLPANLDSRIIDYATKYRSDFLDLFVLSKCRFFLGSSAGLFCVPAVFDVPVSYANGLPSCTPWGKFTMFIPKKLWSHKEKRFIGFKEAFFKYQLIFDGAAYARHEIEAIANTEEENLALCKEMFAVVVKGEKPNDDVRRQVSELMGVGHPWHPATSYMSPSFFEKNRELFLS